MRLGYRFWSKVDKSGDCWTWTAGKNAAGYGYFSVDGRQRRAHRLAYEDANGPIPDGLVIDHLCRNPACVNPSHLEAVTPQVNALRGVSFVARNHLKTHCANGHEFTPENTYQRKGRRGRMCWTCIYARKGKTRGARA